MHKKNMRGPHEPPLRKRTAAVEETKFLEVEFGAKARRIREKIPRWKEEKKFLGGNKRKNS